MEIQQNAFTVKQLYNMEAKGTIRFDYPLQRSDDQWKVEAKSLLIDSIARQYPIPPLFSKQQFRNEAHTATIIQTMMMLEGRERQYEYKDVTQRSLSQYSESFNENAEYKEGLLDQK